MPHYRFDISFTPQQWTSAVKSASAAHAGVEAFVGTHGRAYGRYALPHERRMAFFVEGFEDLGAHRAVVGPFGGRVESINPLISPADDPTSVCDNCGFAGHTPLSCPFP